LSGDRRRTCHRRPGPSDLAARFVYHGRLRVGADPVVGLPGATGEAADSGRGHLTTATTVGCSSAGRPGCVDAEFRYLEPHVWQFPLGAQACTATAGSRKHSAVFGGRRTIIRWTFALLTDGGEIAFWSEDAPGCVETTKGRGGRGIVFYHRRSLRVGLPLLAGTLGLKRMRFYVSLTLQRFDTVKTHCGHPRIGVMLNQRHTKI